MTGIFFDLYIQQNMNFITELSTILRSPVFHNKPRYVTVQTFAMVLKYLSRCDLNISMYEK